MNPSHDSISCARACAMRAGASTRGVASARPSGVGIAARRCESSRLSEGRVASISDSVFGSRPPIAASNASSASVRANGWCSATNAPNVLARPVRRCSPAGRAIFATLIVTDTERAEYTRTMRRFFVLTALLAVTACGSDSSSNSLAPTSVGIYTVTDLVVGAGTTAVSGNHVTVGYTGWLYDPTQTAGKGNQFQANPSYDVTLRV